ncbi:hypothetical protein VTP01DRAFT_6664 [Rhizomucor pusillus]|uniref:uncharacterized protein n=1 Tax=Rhizomucor pusillus TaxID=4840 RepID=UPI00374485B0
MCEVIPPPPGNQSPTQFLVGFLVPDTTKTAAHKSLRDSMATRNRITAGARSIVCQDTELRGEISIGAARVLGSTTIGNNCVIGAACSTESNETITDLTVIYGAESKRRQQSEVLPGQRTLHARHLEYLWEVLPKYNHLKKLETL